MRYQKSMVMWIDEEDTKETEGEERDLSAVSV